MSCLQVNIVYLTQVKVVIEEVLYQSSGTGKIWVQFASSTIKRNLSVTVFSFQYP